MSPHKIHRARLALKKAVQPLGRGGGGGVCICLTCCHACDHSAVSLTPCNQYQQLLRDKSRDEKECDMYGICMQSRGDWLIDHYACIISHLCGPQVLLTEGILTNIEIGSPECD